MGKVSQNTEMRTENGIAVNVLAELALQGRLAFFLDVDKTLGSYEPAKHDGLDADHELTGLIRDLNRICDGAVAIITGRPIRFLENIMPGFRPYAATEHGSIVHDIHTNDNIAEHAVPGLRALRTEIERMFVLESGIVIEDHKTASLTVEFTKAADPERLSRALEKSIETFISGKPQSENIRIKNGSIPGNYYIEILHNDANKGQALETLMAQDCFNGKIPVYIGDSSPDEEGMLKAQELGGFAIGVTGHSPACRDFYLEDYKAVRRYLRSLIDLYDNNSRNNPSQGFNP